MGSDSIYTTRREFLRGGITLLSAASTLPIFLGASAKALAGPTSAKGGGDPILVVLQLAGGNDGLNTIIPHRYDEYYKLRPRLGIKRDAALKLNNEVGLHPSAVGLKELYDDGMMAVIQGVGYPNPNRSHFVSMDIWHSADPRLRAQSGWLGRYFDNCCGGADPGATPEPIDGVALMKEAPLALTGGRFTPLAFENPDSLAWRVTRREREAEEVFRRLNNSDGDLAATSQPMEQFLQRAGLKAIQGADQIRAAAGKQLRGGRRGGELSATLGLVARMIAADLPTRIYYVSLGGFDTHTGQEGRHARLMREFGDGVEDFVDTLKEEGLLDRVLILSFSEFGRRVQENASGGTDHGEAAPLFVFGQNVRGGVHEKHPDLAKLNRGDLQFGVDFRRVYAGVLRDWLDTAPDKVLGQKFNPYPLLKRG